MSLKQAQDAKGKPTDTITEDGINQLKDRGIKGKTVQEVLKDPNFKKVVDAGIAKAN